MRRGSQRRRLDVMDAQGLAGALLFPPLGVEKILFGSDRPHGEGLAEPLQFTKEFSGFSPADVWGIMRCNAIELLGGRAVSD